MIMGSGSSGLSELAAEFPGYDFGTQRTWDGVSIIAIRQAGSERPGLCVVITDDADEMRLALLEGERQHGGSLYGGALPEPRVGSLRADRR
ncbi:MAG TPA: hypothetical protein VGI96_35060 [Streptosporangiaceae bacterium]